jgi:hypothetical protein
MFVTLIGILGIHTVVVPLGRSSGLRVGGGGGGFMHAGHFPFFKIPTLNVWQLGSPQQVKS